MADDESNNISQSHNTVEGDMAGRDIIKNTYNQVIHFHNSGLLDYQSLIATLQTFTKSPKEIICALIKEEEYKKHGYDIISNYLPLLVFSRDSLSSPQVDVKEEYENIVLGGYKINLDEEYLKTLIKAAALCIRKREFEKAHVLFVNALSELDTHSTHYNHIYKEYLVTGFIHYSHQNDMSGLRSLLKKKRPYSTEQDSSIDYIIANIFQEFCSRDTNIESVHKAATSLERIYRTAHKNVKPSMANSLGLAYRRLGERTGISDLLKAIKIFDEGLKENSDNKTMDVSLKDNKAITLVRIFEFVHDEKYLDEAETLLLSCLEMLKSVTDPRDSMIRPRVLNNIGNTFKQRLLVCKDFSSAAKALAYYDEAMEFWTEKSSSYEWGLLKKNVAETKYALAAITNDSDLFIEAMDDCIQSMKYRDIKNSPYQWAKSVEILFWIIIALDKENALFAITPKQKGKALKYIQQIYENGVKWGTNDFQDFYANAEKTLHLLNTR